MSITIVISPIQSDVLKHQNLNKKMVVNEEQKHSILVRCRCK